jgi:hypothetical protein
MITTPTEMAARTAIAIKIGSSGEEPLSLSAETGSAPLVVALPEPAPLLFEEALP